MASPGGGTSEHKDQVCELAIDSRPRPGPRASQGWATLAGRYLLVAKNGAYCKEPMCGPAGRQGRED